MDKRNKIYVLSISIVMIVASILAISFAYIGSRGIEIYSGGGISGNVIDAQGAINLEISGEPSVSLDVDIHKLSSAQASNDYSSYIESSVNVNVDFTTDLSVYTKGVKCNYDIYYHPTSAYTPSQASVNAGLMELAIGGTASHDSFAARNLANVSSPIKLYSSYVKTSSTTATVNQIWHIKMYFYNLNIDQTGALGQNPAGKVVFETTSCEAMK